MTDWRELTIADLAAPTDHALATGPFGSAISSKNFVDAGVPVIRGSNLSTEVGVRLKDEGLAFLTAEKADTFRRSMARRGDLVFTCWGTVGQIGYIDDRAAYDCYIVSNKQMKLTPDPTKVLSEFLYYALSTEASMSQVTGQAIGSAVPGFNLGQLRDIRVVVPDLAHQQRVIDVLGSIDDLIENNRRRVEVLEEMARAVYGEWFVHFRFPGYDDATFIDSDRGPIPEGWERVALADVAEVNRSSRKPGGGEFIRYLDISSLGERTLDEPGPTPGEDAPGRARRVVDAGDSVWSMVRPERRAHALLVNPGEDWIASTGTAVLSPSEVPSSFLFEAVSHPLFTDYLVSRQRGSAYPAVKVADFKAAPLVIPDAQLLRAFDATVSAQHSMSWSLREQSSALARTRDLLLPKLVTGQIDVSDLDLDAVVEKAGI